MKTTTALKAFAFGLVCIGFGACDGHGGHSDGHGHDSHAHGDHGENGHEAHEEGPEPISVTRFSDTLELFMEYPPLVKGEKARFLAHFSVLETGEPVREGKLVVELTKPGGKPFEITIAEPKRAGLFVPVLEFGSASSYRARFRIESPEIRGVVDVGELLVHESAETASDAAKGGDGPHDAIPFLMEQQWKIKMRLAKARKVPLSERLSVPATVEPPPGGEVSVSLPVPGRLKRSDKGAFITAGKRVEKGEILGVLELSPETANKVNQARVKSEFARRKFQRIAQIRKKGVGSQQQFEQAKEEVELAEAEYRSLLGASSALSLSKTDKAEQSEGLVSLPIVAPVSGEIVSAERGEGAFISENEELFRVLNNETVWIESSVSEFDIPKLEDPTDGVLALDAYPEKLFPIQALGGRLVSVGTRVDPKSRSIAVRYELPNKDGMLKFGMFGTVSITTEPPRPRLVIPESSVIYENGVPTAYVLLSGESFQKRNLSLGVKGDGFVEVREGLEPDSWVVSDGAYAVKLASTTPASFGHGHAH